MRMKTFLRFISLLKNPHGIYQQKIFSTGDSYVRSLRLSILPATAARDPVFMIAVILYSLAFNAAVMDNDNLATALSAQIQFSIALIGTVRKLPVVPMVLAKQ